MGMFGFETVNVSARAVAKHESGITTIFAGKNTCGANNEETIHWSGSDVDVVGDVHSNSGVKFNGSNNSVNDAVTYVCTSVVSGSGNSFGSGLMAAGTRAWPITYTSADFPCTYGSLTSGGDFDLASDGSWWVGGTKSSKQLKNGVYCAKGKLVLSDSDIEGTVTFVATTSVQVSGSDFELKPYKNDVLLYSMGSGADAIKVSASGGNWEGMLYAPAGQVDFAGSSNMTLSGGIVAWTVKVSGKHLQHHWDPERHFGRTARRVTGSYQLSAISFQEYAYSGS